MAVMNRHTAPLEKIPACRDHGFCRTRHEPGSRGMNPETPVPAGSSVSRIARGHTQNSRSRNLVVSFGSYERFLVLCHTVHHVFLGTIETFCTPRLDDSHRNHRFPAVLASALSERYSRRNGNRHGECPIGDMPMFQIYTEVL